MDSELLSTGSCLGMKNADPLQKLLLDAGFTDGNNLRNMLRTKLSSTLQLVNKSLDLEVDVRDFLSRDVLQRQSKQIALGFLKSLMASSQFQNGD